MLVAKICGINTAMALDAAVQGGARYVGLMFYPPSPRYVDLERAASLARAVPEAIATVGVFVDADDATLAATLARVRLDYLQLHGSETPARVAEIKQRLRVPVIKVCAVSAAGDVDAALQFASVADRLLFDAREPKERPDSLPGGNGLAFDWQLLGERQIPLPWMLSGGLTAENLAEAVGLTHAPAVDVSSGVESARGVKDPARIAAFLAAAAGL